MDAIFEPRLPGKARVSLAELDVGDIGIQCLDLAQSQAGEAVIIAVCGELFACEIVLFFAPAIIGARFS